ncbi:hypothetical protein [Pseudotabrizicola algicola]|uniref:Uncharacterized protein n=1 Tax=Pseudotabrizicola algicola TaxID=2709381 RepID=A0A6B3RLZ3_9RHOB|nr:hypothetical protein [Pseudotabrizicola algicola]NEX45848.1 hypothetical protein [Pseudotabrizicola algicola]
MINYTALPDSLSEPGEYIIERILGIEVSVLLMALDGVICLRLADQAARRWAGYKPAELQFLERKASTDQNWHDALRIALAEYDVAA